MLAAFPAGVQWRGTTDLLWIVGPGLAERADRCPLGTVRRLPEIVVFRLTGRLIRPASLNDNQCLRIPRTPKCSLSAKVCACSARKYCRVGVQTFALELYILSN